MVEHIAEALIASDRDSKASSSSLGLERYEVDEHLGNSSLKHVLLGSHHEEFLHRLLDVTLNHFRSCSFDGLGNYGLVSSRSRVGLDQVCADLEGKIHLLWVLIANHLANLSSNDLCLASKLARVATGKGFEAL